MPAVPHSIAILGTGLIGGSIGLALRSRWPDAEVVAFDVTPAARRAVAVGAASRAADSVEGAVRDAEVVVLGAPLAASLTLLDEAALHVKRDAFVTDVGSVKAPIVARASRVLPRHATFVGGHPMAGAEHGGIEHADALLFENATWVLCPAGAGSLSADAARAHFGPVVDLVEAVGGRPLIMDASRHDRIAAAVSHLPQLLSVALVNEALGGDPGAQTLAAGGFRDMTRIASSPFAMWREILDANHDAVDAVLDRLGRRLDQMRRAVSSGDWDYLADAFVASSDLRALVPAGRKGFLAPLADVIAPAADRPGTLLAMVRALSEAKLNVSDVELLKVREGEHGVFRFGFASEADAEAAVRALHAARFEARRH
jgi:prephenate dehydrogenase